MQANSPFDQQTPILFYSGEGRAAYIKTALDAGAQGFLLKPVEPDDLIKKVKDQTQKDNHLAAS